MELYQLRYFLAVEAHHNITRAAAECGITQTAMSEQMRKLEESLGAKLLIRGRRHTTLTTAGASLKKHAEAILTQAHAAREAVAHSDGMPTFHLTIGSIPSVTAGLLPRVIQEFAKQRRDVRILIREETSARIAREVESGELDLGVAQLPLARGAFAQSPLLEEPFCVMVSSRNRLCARTTVALRELSNEIFILPRGRARQCAVEACRASGFEPRICCESAEFETIRALVAADLGIAILPALASHALYTHQKHTRIVALSGRAPKRRLALLTPKARPLSDAGSLLAKLLAHHATKQPGRTKAG